jgi:hypothetical protein
LLVPIIPSASALFLTDFESDDVGSTTAAGDIDYIHPMPGAVIRDSSVTAPFGSNNQYLQFGGLGGFGYRNIFTGAPLAGQLDNVIGISFRFYQVAGANWGNNFGIAQAGDPWVPDLNSTYALFTFQFREGNVNLGNNTTLVSGTLPTYDAAKDYTVTYYMNWSGSTEVISGPDGLSIELDHKQAAIWLMDEGAGTFSNPVTVAGALDATQDHVSFVLRNFSSSTANDATAYIDNVSISVIPEPSTYAAMFGLGALVLVALRRRWKLSQ